MGEDAYREKLVTLKESYFPSGTKAQVSSKSETISEGIANEAEVDVTKSMNQYLTALKLGGK